MDSPYLMQKRKYDSYNPMQMDENSQLSPDYQAIAPSTAGQTTSLGTEAPKGIDMAQVGASTAAGAATAGPWGAAIAAAGSLMSQYLGQKAADERNKRQMEAQAHERHGQAEQHSISEIMNNMRGALR